LLIDDEGPHWAVKYENLTLAADLDSLHSEKQGNTSHNRPYRNIGIAPAASEVVLFGPC